MFGIFGHFSVPIDIISSPDANIEVCIVLTAMNHMLIWVQRNPSRIMPSLRFFADLSVLSCKSQFYIL